MTAAKAKEEHGHAHLVVYRVVPVGDLSARVEEVPVPGDIGWMEGEDRDGKKISCFLAVHTHGEGGKLHLEVVDGNNLTLGTFFTSWGRLGQLRRAVVAVDGKQILDAEHYVIRVNENIVVWFLEYRKGEEKHV